MSGLELLGISRAAVNSLSLTSSDGLAEYSSKSLCYKISHNHNNVALYSRDLQLRKPFTLLHVQKTVACRAYLTLIPISMLMDNREKRMRPPSYIQHAQINNNKKEYNRKFAHWLTT